MFEDGVLALLKLAKLAAVSSDASHIDWQHVMVAAAKSKLLDQELAQLFGVEGEFLWPEETLEQARLLDDIKEPEQKIGPSPQLRRLFLKLKAKSNSDSVGLANLAKPLIDLAEDSWRLQFYKLNGLQLNPPETSTTKQQQKSVLCELKSILTTTIIGQEPILESLQETLTTFLCRSVVQERLRGSMLIPSLSGSGKTTILKLLNAWAKSSGAVFDISNAWIVNGSNPGCEYLLQVLKESKPSLLLVDGIDKACPDMLAVLLRMLDHPILEVGPGEVINISGWIVVLTGSMGDSLSRKLQVNDKVLLPTSSSIRDYLIEELPADVHLGETIRAQQLLKGIYGKLESFVPLATMQLLDLSQLMERNFKDLADTVQRDSAVKLKYDDNVVDLMTLAAGYKCRIDGRHSGFHFSQHVESYVRAACLEHADCKEIHLSCEDQRFYSTLPNEKPQILIVDDDCLDNDKNTFLLRYQSIVGEHGDVFGVADVDQALELAQNKTVDFLILDMWHKGKERWQEYLEIWRNAYPETPVVLFSSEPCPPSRLRDISRLGGIMGFLSKQLSDDELRQQIVSCYLGSAQWSARLRAFDTEYGCAGERLELQVTKRVVNSTVKYLYDNVSTVVDERFDESEEPVMPTETREELEAFLGLFLNPVHAAKFRIKQPRGLLLCGPPGTGKTMIARWLAGKMNCGFMTLSSGDFQSKYAGVGSEKVRDVFSKARSRKPCVVFIDEIESVVPKRSHGGSNSSVLADNNATVTTFLAEMDGFDQSGGIFIIGATNHKEAIDNAVLRPGRLDRHIEVGLPGKNERRTLLEYHLNKRNHSINIEWAVQATLGCSGADIVQAINDAALLAVKKNRKDTRRHALEICQEDFAEALDRLKHGTRREQDSSNIHIQRSRERTAWHESGHALLMYLLFKESPPRLTIVSRSSHGGYASISEGMIDKLTSPDEQSCKHYIMTLLAGGLAECIKFGSHSSGVSSDHSRAIEFARDMVGKWGMLGLASQVPFILGSGDPSECHAKVVEIVTAAEAEAKRILTASQKALKALADALLDKEELSGDEVTNIIGKNPGGCCDDDH